ncbi:MAG: cation-translocating P-type ATPase [Oscillospiraceae bacterium]|nr:cation-translocating P-type ATPase [Oscillospiraceae bacterium]
MFLQLRFASLSDTIREDVGKTISKLKAVGIEPMLLTGDNRAAAEAIASRVGITDVHANLLPEEKMQLIKDNSNGEAPVCMIGDGVNDALALTAADVGIAMGGIGSDIAIESADAILVSDDIKRLPYLFGLMQKVMKKVRTNIIASLIINITAVVLSAIGFLTPVTGALWHNFGSVFVVVNAAQLLRVKDEE